MLKSESTILGGRGGGVPLYRLTNLDQRRTGVHGLLWEEHTMKNVRLPEKSRLQVQDVRKYWSRPRISWVTATVGPL